MRKQEEINESIFSGGLIGAKDTEGIGECPFSHWYKAILINNLSWSGISQVWRIFNEGDPGILNLYQITLCPGNKVRATIWSPQLLLPKDFTTLWMCPPSHFLFRI
ncbi:uncharacterized protein RHO17_025672 isoform 2-T4 [Thomomys bottae]